MGSFFGMSSESKSQSYDSRMGGGDGSTVNRGNMFAAGAKYDKSVKKTQIKNTTTAASNNKIITSVGAAGIKAGGDLTINMAGDTSGLTESITAGFKATNDSIAGIIAAGAAGSAPASVTIESPDSAPVSKWVWIAAAAGALVLVFFLFKRK